jgi:hypothetical protein
MIAQISMKHYFFFSFLSISLPQNLDTSRRWNLRSPGQHRPIMRRQGESRGYMHLPLPGVIRNPGPHCNQARDQPVHGMLNLFTPNIKLPSGSWPPGNRSGWPG